MTDPQAAAAGSVLKTNGFSSEWAPLGGDVTGDPSALTVNKLLNRNLATTVPQTGQALIWNGSSWTPEYPGTGGGSVTIKSGTTTVSTTGVLNYSAGTGMLTALTPVNGEAVIQQSVDTNLLETRVRSQSGESTYCNSPVGNGMAFTCTLSPTLPTYTTGLVLHWVPQSNGTGGSTTLKVGNLAAVAVKLLDGTSNPAADDIVAGRAHTVWFDGTSFRILNRNGSRQQSVFCSSSSGSATVYECTASIPFPSYEVGQVLFWRPDVSATAGATTLNVGGLGAVAVKLANGVNDPEAGDILGGQTYTVWYDGVVFRLSQNASQLTPTTATRPGCAAALRGRIWFEEGGTGIQDTVAVCAKDATDTYAWRTIY